MTREYDRSRLTPREMEIAKLAANQLTNREIAERLQISPFTVRNSLQRIFRKLDIHNRINIASRLPRRETVTPHE